VISGFAIEENKMFKMNEKENNILKENKKRLKELNAHFDPLTGEGSFLERFPFRISSSQTIFLPKPMGELKIIKALLKYKSIEDYCKKKKQNVNILINIINELREKHDFEYYAFVNIMIQDKLSKKVIPFKVNKPQRWYVYQLEEERINNRPIRIDLLKTRQWGGSTLTEVYFLWIQDKWRKGWHSVLAGDVEQQAKNMLSIYKTACKNYPKSKGKLTLSPYEGSPKNRYLNEKNCIISIGSMQNPDSLRSSDNAMLHATEIGLWKATQDKKPEDLMQSLLNSIEYIPYTIIVKESTAKGVGNYWHKEYIENTLYKKVFVAWFHAEKNISSIDNYHAFIQSMNPYEWFLWEKGATLEGIKWYRLKLKEMRGDTWRMQSENPTTEQEAFQSTGNRVFSPSDVQKMRRFCYEPLQKGKLFSFAEKGKEAFYDLRFEPTQDGSLWIWDFPENDINMANRYIVVVDIGGKTLKADWSVITVIDRYHLTNGGVPQVVARLRYHIDQDLLAWDAVKIAAFYNNALLVIENNSLRKKQSEETENHFTTILNEIEDYYDNLYTYENPDKIKEGIPVKWGFHTNASTKPMVVAALGEGLRDDGFIDPDSRLYDECDTYEIDASGAYNAVEGQHDDIIMSTAIGLYISSKIDAPFIIKPDSGKAVAKLLPKI
jgi:hypothetical protein